MSVHYVARYFDKPMERVLFVGGGDSMLLHELLKYESVTKIVGMELDQSVARASFQYFGTSLMFHDNGVEWWFGDASVSLNLLPRD